jgi:peptidyl-prolyl cis-trans isomerase A (cyclophilin A)
MRKPSPLPVLLPALLAALAWACSEPEGQSKIVSGPLPEAPQAEDGRHFLAEQPLKTFDKKRSDLWKDMEAIGRARQRQKDYRDKHSVVVDPTVPDPLRGQPLSLAGAVEGITGKGALRAEIVTTSGSISCELLADRQERGVAHFVGLARGTRPWWDAALGRWQAESFYRNLPIYRIDPGRAVFSGCPMGVGFAEVGFRTPAVPEDITVQAEPLTLGVLVSKKTKTMGPQFVVTGGQRGELDVPFVPIGSCRPGDELDRLLREPVAEEGLPVRELVLVRIDILRGEAGAGADGNQ